MGMEQTAKNSALQRKLRAGRAGQAVQAITPARAFRLSTERAAAQDLGLRLDVLGVELRHGPVEELGSDLADDGVILLLNTGAAPAALVCDLQMVSALVEVQTLGQAQARPATPRALTATDAALTHPLLAGVSRRMAGLLPADATPFPPLTAQKRMPDMRALVLEMGTGAYQLWRCSCALGPDRTAEFALLLPDVDVPPAADGPDRGQAAPAPATGGSPDTPTGQVLLDVPVSLGVALCRVPVPLGHLRALAPGDVVVLPPGVLGQAWVHSDTGQVVATGTLGRMHGVRALRLHAGAMADAPAGGAAPRAAAGQASLPMRAPAGDGGVAPDGGPA